MGLLAGPTKWILFLSSSSDAELRHVQDLAYGLYCLESAGVLQKDIAIYIDGSDRAIAAACLSFSSNSYQIKLSNEFFGDVANFIGYRNLVMFISGHGSPFGIDATPPISPTKLLDALKSATSISSAVVYLGQCFAGIFNYVGAGNRYGNGSTDVIFMGATSLHESVSSSTTERIHGIDVTWVANLFLLYVFKWIINPIDIDGDGEFTVMDSYKFAGAMTNYANKCGRSILFDELLRVREEMSLAAKELAAPTPATDTLGKQVEFDALNSKYEQLRNVHFIHQDCWILNAVPAQKISF
ncbi:hypothetical protein GIY21_19845 [Xanthomonas sontii]|uniref:Uncharacterized protein n=1 Tax=Xanthomonas sontii TaxID=2650745 RepID=A0A6N7QI79_9XANT|nr:hypothetical protein [Xanthomonas sontii]MRH02556.1 hypothetical protein [Xanthomonas sontii]MRH76892.1 hypothetical protein [Xanthomonas sontii]